MRGLLDALSPTAWAAEQRAALSGDVAYQRAALTAEMRQVMADGATDAAIKFAIAGVATVAVSIVLWKLATRGSR